MSVAEVCAMVLDICLGVDGVRQAPENPPEQLAVFPACISYPVEWNYELQAARGGVGQPIYTGGDQIIGLDMLWPRGQDIQRTTNEAWIYGDTIPAALFETTDLNGAVLSTTGIEGTFGTPRMGPYAGMSVIGWSWVIRVITQE